MWKKPEEYTVAIFYILIICMGLSILLAEDEKDVSGIVTQKVYKEETTEIVFMSDGKNAFHGETSTPEKFIIIIGGEEYEVSKEVWNTIKENDQVHFQARGNKGENMFISE